MYSGYGIEFDELGWWIFGKGFARNVTFTSISLLRIIWNNVLTFKVSVSYVIDVLSFRESLATLINFSDHIKCISLNNQQCMAQPTLINLNPNEYTERLRYDPFVVNLDKYMGSCNTINDLSNIICDSTNTEDLSFSIFNMITEITASKILSKHILCECKCKFPGCKCNSNQKCENDTCRCESKNPKKHCIIWKRLYLEFCYTQLWKCWIFSKYYWGFSYYWKLSDYVSDEIANYSDSVSTNMPANVMCTVSTSVKKTVSTSFYNKAVRYKINCYIMHTVLLVVILLFIIVFTCYHFAKNRSKQKRNTDTLTI